MSCFHEDTGTASAAELLGTPVKQTHPTAEGAATFSDSLVSGDSEQFTVFDNSPIEADNVVTYNGLQVRSDQDGVLHLTMHAERYGTTGDHYREVLDDSSSLSELGTIQLARGYAQQQRKNEIGEINPAGKEFGSGMGHVWHRNEVPGAMFRSSGGLQDKDYTDAWSNRELGSHMRVIFNMIGAEDGQEVRFHFI